jgi:3'-5' exoribonuclease
MSIPGPYTSKEVASLASGAQFWGKYMVAEKNQRKTRNGRDIINLRLADSSGSIEVVVWDNCQVQGDLHKGVVIGMQADTSLYNNRQQITAKRIKILDENPSAYLLAAPVPRETLMAELKQAVESIADPHLSFLLQTILTPQCIADFSTTPAAKRIHHNYMGGLLEHTLAVVKLCQHAAQLYPELNRDLLVAGAILHDIGKMKEYELQVVPEYTLEGKLLGHIVMGYQLVDQAVQKMRAEGYDFPPMLENMIKHLVLSHHGSLEYGSPVKPLFPEAFLLHVMDNLDAKMFVYFEKMAQTENVEQYVTPYDSFHQQQFFTYRYRQEMPPDPDGKPE